MSALTEIPGPDPLGVSQMILELRKERAHLDEAILELEWARQRNFPGETEERRTCS